MFFEDISVYTVEKRGENFSGRILSSSMNTESIASGKTMRMSVMRSMRNGMVAIIVKNEDCAAYSVM